MSSEHSMAKKKQPPNSQTSPPKSDITRSAGVERKLDQPVATAPDGSPIVAGTSVQSILFNNDAHKAAQLITLAAFYSPISQLTLSPVYGTAQASLYHRWGALATALAAFLCVSFLQPYIPKRIATVIPCFAFWIPILQFILFKCSSLLPMPYGPLITEILTYYPLLFLSVYAAGLFFSKVDLSGFNQTIAEQVPSASAYLLFTGVSRIVRDLLPIYMGSNIIFSRVGLQIVVAGFYGLALPAATLWPALPALGFTMLANVHNPLQRTTDVLNNTLALYNYTLLERRESVTGYISVLENTNDQFRVMRCDHSLLGGEWTMLPPKGRVPRVKEPIFAIFAMLEAVRLVEPAPGIPRLLDTQKRALNIGLGVGTAPTAMIAHGINTTILELDPVVHEFALKYFGLPTNHTFVIGDALQIVQQMIPKVDARYDIIIHDVITGGAEPVDLFTLEFLSNLAALLKPDGVIAIVRIDPVAIPNSLSYSSLTNCHTLELRWRPRPPCRLPRHPHHPRRLPLVPHLPRRRPPQPAHLQINHSILLHHRTRLHQRRDVLQTDPQRRYHVPQTRRGRLPRQRRA